MTTDKWNLIAVVRDGGTGYFHKNGEDVAENPSKGPKKQLFYLPVISESVTGY